MFLTPPSLTDQFCKTDQPIFRKKAQRRRKIFGVPFLKNLTILGKNFEKLTVSVPPQRKKARRRRKIWELFFLRAGGAPKIFRELFHFRPRTPLKKFGDDVWMET